MAAPLFSVTVSGLIDVTTPVSMMGGAAGVLDGADALRAPLAFDFALLLVFAPVFAPTLATVAGARLACRKSGIWPAIMALAVIVVAVAPEATP